MPTDKPTYFFHPHAAKKSTNTTMGCIQTCNRRQQSKHISDFDHGFGPKPQDAHNTVQREFNQLFDTNQKEQTSTPINLLKTKPIEQRRNKLPEEGVYQNSSCYLINEQAHGNSHQHTEMPRQQPQFYFNSASVQSVQTQNTGQQKDKQPNLCDTYNTDRAKPDQLVNTLEAGKLMPHHAQVYSFQHTAPHQSGARPNHLPDIYHTMQQRSQPIKSFNDRKTDRPIHTHLGKDQMDISNYQQKGQRNHQRNQLANSHHRTQRFSEQYENDQSNYEAALQYKTETENVQFQVAELEKEKRYWKEHLRQNGCLVNQYDRQWNITYNQEASRQCMSENKNLQRQVAGLIEEKHRLEKQLRSKEKTQQTVYELTSEIRKVEEISTKYQKESEFYKSKVQSLNDELQKMGENLRQAKSSEQRCQNCWRYKDDISDLKKEINSLRDRLSEAAGNKLRDNNPNIADLSDMNRPTSLAEKFSSLYTDAYSDAMEVIEGNMDEAACVDFMLQMLKQCNDWCERLAEEQRALLNTESVGFINKYLGQHCNFTISQRCFIYVKEFQKKVAFDSLAAIEKVCLENNKNWEPYVHSELVVNYIKKCSELCWMMQISDPPLYLKFDVRPGDNLDRNMYNVFTKSGNQIRFLVWPVVYLHKTGPILVKGVAQGM